MSQTNHSHNELEDCNLTRSATPQTYEEILHFVIEEVEKSIKLLEKECEDIPWENPIIYAEYLAQSYYQTSHTPRLEALAISRCSAKSKFSLYFLKVFKGK